MSNVSGQISLTDASGTSVATYTLSKVKHDTYDWDSLVDASTDLTESITAHVNGGLSIA